MPAKTIPVALGDIIIIEHPLFRDQYSVARVETITAKMIGVTYWKRLRMEWNDETKKRAKEAVIGKLIRLSDNETSDINDTYDALDQAHKAMRDAVKAAERDYMDVVYNTCEVEAA